MRAATAKALIIDTAATTATLVSGPVAFGVGGPPGTFLVASGIGALGNKSKEIIFNQIDKEVY